MTNILHSGTSLALNATTRNLNGTHRNLSATNTNPNLTKSNLHQAAKCGKQIPIRDPAEQKVPNGGEESFKSMLVRPNSRLWCFFF
jgi:hypothetical protein